MIGIDGAELIILAFAIGVLAGILTVMGFIFTLGFVAKVFGWSLKRS